MLNHHKSEAGQADRLVLRLSCPADVEDSRLFCQAMVQELAAAVESSIVRPVPVGEEAPTRAKGVGIAFTVVENEAGRLKGRLDWQIGQKPQQTGAEIQLDQKDTARSQDDFRRFARSLVMANKKLLASIELVRSAL